MIKSYPDCDSENIIGGLNDTRSIIRRIEHNHRHKRCCDSSLHFGEVF